MRSLCLLLTIASSAAVAEGAMQTFDCTTTAICDEEGACVPAGGTLRQAVTFRIEPVSVGPRGEGEYRISYSDVSAPMTNVTGLGPLLWSEGDADSQVILITSETNLLWQRFDASTARSAMSFLACEVTR